MRIKKIAEIKTFLEKNKGLINNFESFITTINIENIISINSLKNKIYLEHSKYTKLAEKIKLRIIEIHNNKINLSRNQNDLILDEISSLKYLTRRIAKSNHFLLNKITKLYKKDYSHFWILGIDKFNKKNNEIRSKEFNIHTEYWLLINEDFPFIINNQNNIYLLNI